METVSLYLDNRIKRESGRYSVKIRITLDRKSTYITTGVNIPEDNWDTSSKRVCNIREAERYNAYLSNLIMSIQQYYAKLEIAGDMAGKTLAELKAIAETIRDDGGPSNKKKGEFLAGYKAMIASRRTKGTRQVYTSALNALMRYDPELKDRTFADIDKKYVKEYIDYRFAQGRKNNTVLNDLKGIQLTIAIAIEEGKAIKNHCTGFKIKRGITIHRNLSAEFLRSIFNGEYDKYDKPYIDLYKLMFLLRGINVADLCVIDPEQIINGRLEYNRLKTGTHYSVKIEPEAYEIIKRYQSKTRLMNILDGKDRDSVIVCLNKRLYQHFRISSYSARHSVASIAAELGISLDIISQLLGHKSYGNQVTMVYVHYDSSDMDKAMRRIIDYVLYGKK